MQLHKTQVSILRSLLYNPESKFSELMRPTGHTSDTFKFHLQKLAKLDYVTKLHNGNYQLTTAGKTFANNLDEHRLSEQKQPKLSVLIIAAKDGENGDKLFLLQKRQRQPYFNFWGEITSPVRWGWPFQDTAREAFTKQTGLQADFAIRGIRRIRDFDTETDALYEDKVFILIEATAISGKLRANYPGGKNAWLSLRQLKQQEHFFPTTPNTLQTYLDGNFYTADDIFYQPTEY